MWPLRPASLAECRVSVLSTLWRVSAPRSLESHNDLCAPRLVCHTRADGQTLGSLRIIPLRTFKCKCLRARASRSLGQAPGRGFAGSRGCSKAHFQDPLRCVHGGGPALPVRQPRVSTPVLHVLASAPHCLSPVNSRPGAGAGEAARLTRLLCFLATRVFFTCGDLKWDDSSSNGRQP